MYKNILSVSIDKTCILKEKILLKQFYIIYETITN